MAQLEFDLAGVRKLCEHAMAATEWSRAYEDMEEGGSEARPGLILVGDRGVYLMSNGNPGLLKEDGKGHVVVYAEGINPTVDDFETWWAAKNATFGGDDGAYYIPWALPILKMIGQNPNATKLQIELLEDTLELKGVA
jgi:hypothetical protein